MSEETLPTEHFHATGVCLHCYVPKHMGLFIEKDKAEEFIHDLPRQLVDSGVEGNLRAKRLLDDVIEITYNDVHRVIMMVIRCEDDYRRCTAEFQMYTMQKALGQAMEELMEKTFGQGQSPDEPFNMEDATQQLLKDMDLPFDFGGPQEA